MSEDREREKKYAAYILEALQELYEAAKDAKATPTHRSLIAAIVENLNEYRAERDEELIGLAVDALDAVNEVRLYHNQQSGHEWEQILKAHRILAALVGVKK